MDDLSLQELADLYNELRNTRLDIERQAEEIKEQESAAQALLMTRMREERLTTLGGQTCTIRYHKKDRPTADDWPTIWDYIRETGEFDLLYRRLNDKAIAERWEAQQEIPGVGHYEVESITVSQKVSA